MEWWAVGQELCFPTGLMMAGWGYWSPEVLKGDVIAGYQMRLVRRQETDRLCSLWPLEKSPRKSRTCMSQEKKSGL